GWCVVYRRTCCVKSSGPVHTFTLTLPGHTHPGMYSAQAGEAPGSTHTHTHTHTHTQTHSPTLTQGAELRTGSQGGGQPRHDAPVRGEVEAEVQQAGDQVHGGTGQDAAVR